MTTKKETKRTLRRELNKAAYVIVDIEALHPETKADIVADAAEGGHAYGLRVVEIAINGPAQAPIYGYYKDSPDEERWNEAKAELNLDDIEVEDATGLREAAAKRSAEDADKQREKEEAELAEITGEEKADAKKAKK